MCTQNFITPTNQPRLENGPVSWYDVSMPFLHIRLPTGLNMTIPLQYVSTLFQRK